MKTSFGEVVVEGDNAQEILDLISSLSPEFIERVNNLKTSKLPAPSQTQLEGIVEFTTEGPIITARSKFTHYEAIGLVVYASDGRMSTANRIHGLLQSSGVKSMVPARLNEMTKRGLVFKPNPKRSEVKLTTQGLRWIEEEVIPKLRGKAKS